MPLRLVDVQQSILRKNVTLAEDWRKTFRDCGTYVLNLLSSPGSGKTTLLEETLRRLQPEYRVGALVGDQATDNDSQRLARSGARVRQISTGAECRLDAQMIGVAMQGWEASDFDLLAIENVGNLICPAEYDLGEDLRVALFSVTEGEDKPLKYPLAFNTAHLALITKVDLAQAVEFNRELAIENIQKVHPGIPILELSGKTSQGVSQWLDFLKQRMDEKRQALTPA